MVESSTVKHPVGLDRSWSPFFYLVDVQLQEAAPPTVMDYSEGKVPPETFWSINMALVDIRETLYDSA